MTTRNQDIHKSFLRMYSFRIDAVDQIGNPMSVQRTDRAFGPEPTKPLDFEGAHKRFLHLLNPNRVVPCSHCGAVAGVQLESSRTAYATSCPFVPEGKDRIFDMCTAGLDGKPCLQGHATREECPSWPMKNPNADVPLCRDCAKLHHEFWDAMWDEYNRGRM